MNIISKMYTKTFDFDVKTVTKEATEFLVDS